MKSEQRIVEDENDNTPANKSNGSKHLIAIVVIATLAAIYFVPSEQEANNTPTEPVSSNTEKPSLLTPNTTEIEPAKKTAIEPTVPKKVIKLPEGAAARALITELRQQKPLDLERAFTTAQEYQKNNKLSDAYLLYFFAAREGHGGAAMSLAQQADPAYKTDNSVFGQADEIQANKWYVKAQQAGIQGADEALNTLRTTVEKAAAQGDARAQRIMLQWK